VLTSRIATPPLYPSYPNEVLVGKIGIAPHRQSGEPVNVTAFYCDGGATIRLVQRRRGTPTLTS
jgi:hypothetical protein